MNYKETGRKTQLPLSIPLSLWLPLNVNARNEPRVPVTAATVMDMAFDTPPDAIRHSTAVRLIHDDVVQPTDATAAVGVASKDANPRPNAVAGRPPVEGALPFSPTLKTLTTGAAM